MNSLKYVLTMSQRLFSIGETKQILSCMRKKYAILVRLITKVNKFVVKLCNARYYLISSFPWTFVARSLLNELINAIVNRKLFETVIFQFLHNTLVFP